MSRVDEYVWKYLMMKVKIGVLSRMIPFDIIISIAVTLASGWDWMLFGKLWLTLMMSLFGIPLLFIFNFPLWILYIIIVTWILELADIHQFKKTVEKIEDEILQTRRKEEITEEMKI